MPPNRQGRFRRLRQLGSGGAGRVWLVEDRRQPGSRLALKELLDTDPGRAESLRREFATLAALRHPNLVEVFEWSPSAERAPAAYTLEFVAGRDLVAAARAEGVATLTESVGELLRALGFLHDLGVVHRDLKPANVLVRDARPGPRVAVLDFGLALRGADEAVEARPAGTLEYLAPEILAGRSADRRSDLYSVGVMVHEAIHGSPPHRYQGDLGAFLASVHAGAESRTAGEAYPGAVTVWLGDMLAPAPSDRPPNAAEALARWAAAWGVDLPLETRATRAARLQSGEPPGRGPELTRLWELLDDPRVPRVIWIAGDAGCGKTRLLRWVAAEAARRGWDVLAGAEGLSSSREDGLSSLRRRARGHRTLVVVDEAEGASPSLTACLRRVAQEPEAAALQIVVAVRPAEVREATLGRLVEQSGLVETVARIDLPPLGVTAIGVAMARVTGGAPGPAAWADRLLQLTEGNPSLVEAALIEGNLERLDRNTIRTLKRATDERIERLSDPARSWLAALAVLGQPLPAEIVAAVADQSPEVAREARAELGRADAVRNDGPHPVPSSRWVAKRALASLLPGAAREMYRRAVDRVGAQSTAAGAARLWAGAGDPERSIECALRAADELQRDGAPQAAAEVIRSALVQLPRRDRRRGALRARHAELLELADRPREAARAMATVVRCCGDPRERSLHMARWSFLLAMARRLVLAERVAQRAIELADQVSNAESLDRAHNALALIHQLRGEETRGVEILERALERGVEAAVLPETLTLLAVCESQRRRSAEALRCIERALPAAQEHGDALNAARLRLVLGQTLHRSGELEPALAAFTEAETRARRLGNDRLTGLLALNRALVLFDLGRHDVVLQRMRAAEPLSWHAGGNDALLQCRLLQADALMVLGRPGQAAALLERSLQVLRGGVSPLFEDLARGTIAEALVAQPVVDDARARECLEPLLARESLPFKVAMLTLVVELERRGASPSGESLEPIWQRFVARFDRAEWRSDPAGWIRALLARGRAALRDGDGDTAAAAAADAGHLAESADLPGHLAAVQALVAEVALRRGDHGAVAAALDLGRGALERAASRIDNLDLRRDFLDRPVFAALRPKADRRLGEEARLLALYRMVHALNSESDVESVLDSMLDMALEVVGAERGLVLLRDDGLNAFNVRRARNLDPEIEADAVNFSRNVVRQAGAGQAVLSVDTATDERLREYRSLSALGIRSVICVPLRLRGRNLGAVYVDNRARGGVFDAGDLRFLEAFANHAALALENAHERDRLQRANRRLRVDAAARTRLGEIVGRSPGMQRLYDLIPRVARTHLPVLIQGESGTGKELVARAIHQASQRADRPFLSENCAAIAESLLESELFGHVRGAFTGAERDRRGLFEQADGGTLLLDEVGDMSPGMQARLLRVLQEGVIRPVGGERTQQVDVRVLAATHRDLQAEVAAGRFREDLFYRLQVLLVRLPPLRERLGDIPLLVQHFRDAIGRARDRPAPALRREALELLERHAWPGNVRQLEATLQRLILLAGDDPITEATFRGDRGLRETFLGASAASPVFSLQRNERDQIVAALRDSDGNKAQAARRLGISRATIFRKVKEYGL